jgi:hypothetical protein
MWISTLVIFFWHNYCFCCCCQAYQPIGLAKRPSPHVTFSDAASIAETSAHVLESNNNATVSCQPVVDETVHLEKYRMVLPQRKQRRRILGTISQDVARRLQRSVTVGAACVLTYGLVAHLRLSAIAASASIGMVSCVGFSPAMAAAGLCGSFAGMSSHLTSWADATVLGCLAGTSYFTFDQYKIGVGRGGRLGLIAFLANVAYLGQPFRMVTETMELLGSRTAAISLLAGTVLHFSRQMNLEQQQSHESSKALTVSRMAKLCLLGTIGSRLLFSVSSNPVTTVLPTLLTNTAIVLAASQAIQWSSGVVLPVAILGALGSFTPWAAPFYMGAFLGMTQLPSYRASLGRFVQASVFAALLLQLGVFNGMGGKLGMLAFLGVYFGI